jgi:hypothetical protein
MFGKQQKKDMRFMLWFGEKALIAGDSPTPEEHARMFECREHTKSTAKLLFKLHEEDYAYTPGQAFKD